MNHPSPEFDALPTAPTVIQFWAPTCAECRAMEPDLDTVAERFAGRVSLMRIDVSAGSSLASALAVRATPTMVGVANGNEVFRTTGRRTRSELEEIFSATDSNTQPKGIGRQDRGLRLIAGGGLVALGVFTGTLIPAIVGALLIAAALLFSR